MKYIRRYNGLLENMAQAKAVLRKKNIDSNDERFQQILNITNKDGYTGFITKLVFSLGVDLQEALDLYSDLKEKSIDLGIISKMSYDEVLDLVYEDDEDDVQFAFKFEDYTVYYVPTYTSGLKICSPAWCLKTKKHWNDYMVGRKGKQFVAIQDKGYKKRKMFLSTPDNYFSDLSQYRNTKIPEIRYGITVYSSGRYYYYDDDNRTNSFETSKLDPMVNEIKIWMEENNIKYETSLIDNIADYEETSEEISDALSSMSNSSFLFSGYSSKIKPEEIIDHLVSELNQTKEQILLFFNTYREQILSDDTFIANNAISDMLLYHVYGAEEHPLSGNLLREEYEGENSWKYTYNYSKHIWGRKMIEQSYGTIAKWYQRIVRDFEQSFFDEYSFHYYEFFGNNLIDMDNDKKFRDILKVMIVVENVKNGALVKLNMKDFYNRLKEDNIFQNGITLEMFTEEFFGVFDNDDINYNNNSGDLIISFLDK